MARLNSAIALRLSNAAGELEHPEFAVNRQNTLASQNDPLPSSARAGSEHGPCPDSPTITFLMANTVGAAEELYSLTIG
jgi:hypothetical protein